jgi:hypothetical protein
VLPIVNKLGSWYPVVSKNYWDGETFIDCPKRSLYKTGDNIWVPILEYTIGII